MAFDYSAPAEFNLGDAILKELRYDEGRLIRVVLEAVRSVIPDYRGPDEEHEIGILRESTEVSISYEDMKVRVSAYCDDPEHEVAWRSFVYGSEPHIIQVRDPKSWLHYRTWDGEEHFAKRTFHPGTPAFPLALYANQAAKDAISDLVGPATTRAVRKVMRDALGRFTKRI